ncbi:MAG: hypothetical protein AAGI44_11960 [Pseudomonadota bacterium]
MTTGTTDIYGIHPDPELNRLIASHEFPHQGQDPRHACAVFVGLDANYSGVLTEHAAFMPFILDYHRDGVGFWQQHGVHHPFLLDQYPLPKNTGGVPYHRKISRMGLSPDYADNVSFIELLPCATTGRTEESLFWDMFDREHALKIDALVASRAHRLIIISSSVRSKVLRHFKAHMTNSNPCCLAARRSNVAVMSHPADSCARAIK